MRRLAALFALTLLTGAGAAEPKGRVLEFQVGDRKRAALVFAPERNETPAPVVFVFHGHGGTARDAAKTFNYQKHWPEAIAVYMQGVPTPDPVVDPAGTKAGWQYLAGGSDDRDLKFFDAVWARLKADYKVDEKRVYAAGHSNGAGFTYLLWATRGDVFAALAPSAGGGAARKPGLFKPKPVLQVAGENDPLVPFALQLRNMDAVRAINGCEPLGRWWCNGGTFFPSPRGTPFVALIHGGGHKYPDWATDEIVRFFKGNPKR